MDAVMAVIMYCVIALLFEKAGISTYHVFTHSY